VCVLPLIYDDDDDDDIIIIITMGTINKDGMNFLNDL